MVGSKVTGSSFACMEQCAMRQWDGEGCNAWRYVKETKVCQMGEVTSLEDTDNSGVLVSDKSEASMVTSLDFIDQ